MLDPNDTAAIEAAEAAKTKWLAGWNMPGYLPESDPALFDDWQDAHGYIYDAIDRFWDDDYGLSSGESVDTIWLEIHTQLATLPYGEPFSLVNGDQSLVFWVQQADNDDFNIAGDN